MNNTMILYNRNRYVHNPLELHICEINYSHSFREASSITIKAVAENHIYPVIDASPSYSPEPQIQCPALIDLIKEFYRPGDILELYDPMSDEGRTFRCRNIIISGREVTFEGNNLTFEKEGGIMKTVNVDHSFLVPESVKRIITNNHNYDSIKKVVFNPPATIILWNDGTKTVVKNSPGDKFDPYFGFIAACAKDAFGNNSKIKKLLKEKSNIKNFESTTKPAINHEEDDVQKRTRDEVKSLMKAIEGIERLGLGSILDD